MNDNTVDRPAGPGRARNLGLWTLQAGVAFLLASAGVLKLTADPAMVDLFADIGAGQWLRVVVGTLDSFLGAPLDSATLTAANGSVTGGTVIATNVGLSASTGIGASGTPLLTQAGGWGFRVW